MRVFLFLLGLFGWVLAQDWRVIVEDSKELKIWTDAYMQCMADMEESATGVLKEYADLVKDNIVYKKLLIDGAIPPPRIIVETKHEETEGGVVRIEKVYFVPVPYEELMRFEYFKRRIEEKKDRVRKYSGFWVYVKTTSLPKPIVGLYKFIAKREGLNPFVRSNVLVFHIAPTREDASLIRERLKEKYGIIAAIGEVREGKEIDPALLNLLMTGGMD